MSISRRDLIKMMGGGWYNDSCNVDANGGGVFGRVGENAYT